MQSLKQVLNKIRLLPVAEQSLSAIHRVRTGGEYTISIGTKSCTFVSPTPWIHDRLQHQERKETKIIEHLLEETQQSDIFWDVGAAFGIYTCFVASTGASVISFEPNHNSRILLNRNIRREMSDIIISEIALGASSETLYYDKTTEQVVVNEPHHKKYHRISVESGDNLVNERTFPSPTVIKIDVEGAELEVLKGLEKTIAKSVERIYIETHPQKGYSSIEKEVQEWLAEQNYHTEFLSTDEGNEAVVFAEH